MTAWIILIAENIFLIFLLLIWINRNCSKCQKVKCIERVFNKTCQSCQDKPEKAKKREQVEL